MAKVELGQLEKLMEFERSQLHQTLEFLNMLNATQRKTQDEMMEFELGWLGIEDEKDG